MPLSVRSVLVLLLTAAALPAQRPALVQSVPVETDLADPGLPHAREVWPEMIRAARRSVDLAEFYVTNGPDRAASALEPVLRALEEAGARGVKVRVLLSDRMVDQDPASVARLRGIPGAQVRLFTLGTGHRGILHAKYFLVDGEEAFLGSQNLDWRALQHIHETGLRFRTPELVKPLAAVFETDWAFAATGVRPAPAPAAAAPAGTYELVASPAFLNPPGVRPALDALLDLLAGARDRIKVQLLTYSPVSGRTRYWPALDGALRAAAVRGVKVRLMVSDWNLEAPAVDHLKSLALLPGIEVGIVAIPEAAAGHIPYARVIHTKAMTVDGAVLWLGTSNWGEDYFTASRNVEVVARDPALAAQGEAVFDRLWASPYRQRLDPGRAYTPRRRD